MDRTPLETAFRAVHRACGVDRSALCGAVRSGTVNRARAAIATLMRYELHMSCAEVGRELNRDKSIVWRIVDHGKDSEQVQSMYHRTLEEYRRLRGVDAADIDAEGDG